MMDIQLPPPLKLSEYIDYFWVKEYEFNLNQRSTDIIIPNNSIDLLFNFGTDYQFLDLNRNVICTMRRGAYLVGHRTRSMIVLPGQHLKLIAVKFKSFGLHPFSLRDLSVLTDQVAPASDYLEQSFKDLAVQVFKRSNYNDVIDLVSGYFTRSLLQGERNIDYHTIHFLKRIYHNCDCHNLKHILSSEGVNYKLIERSFRYKVGLGPKKILQVFRFNKAIQQIGIHPDPDYSRFAVAYGYYDKSHFTKEFYNFTGMSPSTFVKKNVNLMCLKKQEIIVNQGSGSC